VTQRGCPCSGPLEYVTVSNYAVAQGLSALTRRMTAIIHDLLLGLGAATGYSLLTHDRDAGPFDAIHAGSVLVQPALPWATGQQQDIRLYNSLQIANYPIPFA